MPWPDLNEVAYWPPHNYAFNTKFKGKLNSSRQADFERIKKKWLEIEERFNSAKQANQILMDSEDKYDLPSRKTTKIDAFDLIEYIQSLSDLQIECDADPILLKHTGVLQARCEDLLVVGYFSLIDFNCQCSLLFGKLIFLEEVHIVNSTFAKKIYFLNSIFEEILIRDCNLLEEFEILANVRLNLKIETSRLAHFKAEVHVNGEMSLSRSSFAEKVEFNDCVIGGRLEAGNTTFEKELAFWGVEIGESIKDYGYISVQFADSVFKDKTSFRFLRFFSIVSFDKAQFKNGWANFGDSVFMNTAVFENIEFECEADFENCKFLAGSTFQNTTFNFSASFKDCVFHSPPRFHGSTLHQGTTFFKAKFPQVKTEYWDSSMWDNQDQMAFRTLKLLMAAQREQHQEAKFFALELKAQRQAEYSPRILTASRIGQPFMWVLSMLYYMTSNYGQSPTRAINSFLIWNAGFAFLFWSIEKWAHKIWIANYCIFKTCLGIDVAYQIFVVPASLTQTGSALARVPAFTLALQNTLNPLGLLSEKSLIFSQSLWIYCLSFIQSIGSLALFTLFLLAIRGRFQKGSGGGTA